MKATNTQQVKKSEYRPEIDGLRAFAVVAVIINHFNKDLLPGGYLGVDIFFVISGYVITSSLFRRPSKDFRDFISGFYERRIKRLVPALSVFVLITSVAICLFNSSPGASLKTGLTSLFGLSNIYLLRQSTDYFAQSTELNVFTHTWSLGVEEQFYILFPFLIWFSGFGRQTKNGARTLFLIVSVLTITSLIGFLYLYPRNQPAAYFMLPSRFWEMAAGSLIFIGFQKRVSIEQFLEKIPPVLVLTLIVGVMYLPTSMASVSTIAVVAMSSVLIASLKEGTATFKVFTNTRVVYIGLISYSLYLWHWGVLSISRWTIGVHWWSAPVQVALMLCLAAASYQWIEMPLRKGYGFGRRWKNILNGFGVLILTSLSLTILGSTNKLIYLGKEIKPEETPLTISGKSLRDICLTNTKSVEEVLNECMFAKNKENGTIWLVGDSHAEALLSPISALTEDKNMNLFTYFYGATAFPSTPHKTKNDDRMIKSSQLVKLLQERILQIAKEKDLIFIGMRYPYHFGIDWYEFQSNEFLFNDEKGNFITLENKDLYFSQWENNLRNFAERAREKGINIIIMTPTPEFPTAKGKNCLGVDNEWFNRFSQDDCGFIDSKLLVGDNGFYTNINRRLMKLRNENENIYLFDAFKEMCPKPICRHYESGMPLYRDDDHISNIAGMKRIYPGLKKFLIRNNLMQEDLKYQKTNKHRN